MKKSMLMLCLISLYADAYAVDYTDTARVVSSSPIYERGVEPKRECWMESAPAAPERSMGGALVGGIAGGLLGSQVGRGSGSTAATGAGAVAGAMIGDRVANPDSNRSATGGIVGGLAGALLGSQVGGGSGNKAATAAGGMAGVLVGDRVANPSQGSGQVQRCREAEVPREVIKGYKVVYRYNNQDISTTLPYQPGATLRVGVSLSVLDEPQERRYEEPANRRNGERRYDDRRYDERSDRRYQ